VDASAAGGGDVSFAFGSGSGRVVRSPGEKVSVNSPGARRKASMVKTQSQDELANIEIEGDMSWMEIAVHRSDKMMEELNSKTNVYKPLRTAAFATTMAVKRVKKEFDSMKEELQKLREEVGRLRLGAPTPSLQVMNKRKNPSPESGLTPTTSKKMKEDGPSRREGQETRRRPKPRRLNVDKKEEKVASQRPIKVKAEALKIELTGASQGMYSDILAKVKDDPSLQELGDNVSRVKRTKAGDMLIELRSDPSIRCVDYKEKLEKVVKEAANGLATVKALTQEVEVQCKYMDETATAEEFRECLRRRYSLEEGQCGGIIRMRRIGDRTQIGTIRLPVAVANKVLAAGDLKVGWADCRLRQSKEPTKCFKCLEYGHVSSSCGGVDRSKTCWRCGKNGHKAKDCRDEARCLLCKEGDDRAHVTGGNGCKFYKEAAARAVKK
jgi:Zinc knuckle